MVPEGWKPTKLGDISSLVTSGSRDWAKFYSDSGSKFIRMTNLRRDGIHLKMDDLKFVNIESGSADGKRTSLQAGDILISITAELGKIGWVPPGLGEAYINQHTALVRVEPTESESKFVAYLLSSKPYHRRINALNDAGAKAGLNLATIRSLPIALPDIPEQKKIAQILSTWDQAITATERLLGNSQQRKKGLMQQLLTGKKRLPGFEGEFKAISLSAAATITMGTSPKSAAYNSIEEGLPLLQGNADIEGRRSKPRVFTSEVTKVCQPGDILLSVRAPVGSVAISNHEACIGRGICAIKAKDMNNQEFLYQWMLWYEPRWASLSQGSTFESVNSSDIKNLLIQLPEPGEQKAISNVLSAADLEFELLEIRLNRLKHEKKALMQQLLTGKRRVKVESHAA